MTGYIGVFLSFPHASRRTTAVVRYDNTLLLQKKKKIMAAPQNPLKGSMKNGSRSMNEVVPAVLGL